VGRVGGFACLFEKGVAELLGVGHGRRKALLHLLGLLLHGLREIIVHEASSLSVTVSTQRIARAY
jgi:hypothetical protein